MKEQEQKKRNWNECVGVCTHGDNDCNGQVSCWGSS